MIHSYLQSLTRMFAKRQNVANIARNISKSNNRKNQNIEFNSTDFICNIQGTGTCFIHKAILTNKTLLIKQGFNCKGGPCMKQVPVLHMFE